jgi:hypothetical protein
MTRFLIYETALDVYLALRRQRWLSSVSLDAMREPVLEISDFFDGPRAGVALLHGIPHRFTSRHLDVSEYSGGSEPADVFELVPLSSPAVPPILAEAVFHVIPGQSDLPPGVFRKMEVVWRVISEKRI